MSLIAYTAKLSNINYNIILYSGHLVCFIILIFKINLLKYLYLIGDGEV